MNSFDPSTSTDIDALKQYYAAQATTNPSLDWFVLLPFFIFFGIIVVAAIVLVVIAMWHLLRKADEKPWKSIIPIYNTYMLCKISNRVKSFIVVVILSILGMFLSPLISYFDGDLISILLSVLSIGIEITCIVFYIFILNGVSHAFGHGRGYTIGLLFLGVIYICILAFGKSKYTPEAVFKSKQLEK